MFVCVRACVFVCFQMPFPCSRMCARLMYVCEKKRRSETEEGGINVCVCMCGWLQGGSCVWKWIRLCVFLSATACDVCVFSKVNSLLPH